MAKRPQEHNIYESTIDELGRFEHFFLDHWKKIINICVTIVIVVGFVAVFLQQYKRKGIIASSELGKAKTVEEIKKALESHSGCQSADFARLRLGKLLFEDGKYDEAFRIFRDIGTSSKLAEVLWQARINEAYTLEVLNKTDEAAERFSVIGKDFTASYSVRFEANYNAARLFLEVGKKDRAKDCLKSMNLSVSRGQELDGNLWIIHAARLGERFN